MKAFITTLTAFFAVAFTLANADPLNLTRKGIAIKGYDPVAYFTQNKAVKGKSSIAENHKKATYYFSTESHRDLFKKNPQKYLPEYGGYCAYGVSVGKLIKVNPKVFSIHEGRLLLQYNQSVADDFAQNLSKNVKTADQKWQSLKKS